MAVKRTKTDGILRQRVLSFAKQAGDQAASEKFGVARSTVRTWRFQANRSASGVMGLSDVASVPSGGASGSGDEVSVDELRRSIRRSHRTFDKAVVRLNQVLETSKNPQAIAIAAGIMQTKSGEMSQLVMAWEEHDIRLENARGELLAAALRSLFTALSITVTPAIGRALREALEGTNEGGPIRVSPEVAEAAAADVRAAAGRRELPAPDEAAIDGQLTVDEVIEATPTEDVTDAEVLEEPLPSGWLEMNHNDPIAARRAYDRFKQEKLDREQRERDRPDQWRTGAGSGTGSAIYEAFREPSIPSPGGLH